MNEIEIIDEDDEDEIPDLGFDCKKTNNVIPDSSYRVNVGTFIKTGGLGFINSPS